MKPNIIDSVKESDRTNKKIEEAVNKGVAVALMGNAAAAAKIMQDAGVPRHVSSRVLLHPQLRRATDWKK